MKKKLKEIWGVLSGIKKVLLMNALANAFLLIVYLIISNYTNDPTYVVGGIIAFSFIVAGILAGTVTLSLLGAVIGVIAGKVVDSGVGTLVVAFSFAIADAGIFAGSVVRVLKGNHNSRAPFWKIFSVYIVILSAIAIGLLFFSPYGVKIVLALLAMVVISLLAEGKKKSLKMKKEKC